MHMRTGDRNLSDTILEGLRAEVNEGKSSGNYISAEDIRSNSKVRNFFADSTLVEVFYDFLTEWNRVKDDYYKKNLPNLERRPIEFSIGKNYLKLVANNSVVGFVDKYGNVYKAANWNAPASGVRYYLDDWDRINFDAYGGFLYGNKNLTPRDADFYAGR